MSTRCFECHGTPTFANPDFKVIGVPTFANRTTVFNLETTVTQKVRAEFIGRGRYRIVPDPAGVDALLTGEVVVAAAQDAGPAGAFYQRVGHPTVRAVEE